MVSTSEIRFQFGLGEYNITRLDGLANFIPSMHIMASPPAEDSNPTLPPSTASSKKAADSPRGGTEELKR